MYLNKEVITIAIILACIAIGKEKIYPKIKQKKTKKSSIDKNKIISDKIAELYKVDKKHATIGEINIEQGDRITFQTEEFGFVVGEFIGLKNSNAQGYTSHFIIKRTDNTIISAPIEIIEEDTLTVYKS